MADDNENVHVLNGENHQAQAPPNPVLVETISVWWAFVTQSDLSNRLTKETWYGHHQPLRRVVLFFVLATVVAWLVDSAAMMVFSRETIHIPIWSLHTSREELREIRASHTACARSLCAAAREIQFECVLQKDGTSETDFRSYTGPEVVPIPESCHTAAEKTFGFRIDEGLSELATYFTLDEEDGVLPKKEGVGGDASHNKSGDNHKGSRGENTNDKDDDPLGIRNMLLMKTQRSDTKQASLLKLGLNCELAISFEDDPIGVELTTRRMGMKDISKPTGHRELVVVSDILCPSESINYEIRETLELAYTEVYELLFDFRFLVFLVGCFTFHAALCAWYCLSRGCCLVLTTAVLRWLIPWPDDRVGAQTVTFWSTWQALWILSVVTSWRHIGDWKGAIFVAILMGVALYYGDRSAALAWFDLFVMWLATPYVTDFVGPYVEALGGSFGGSDLVSDVVALFNFIFPAPITLWIFYRAHPLREKLVRQLFKYKQD